MTLFRLSILAWAFLVAASPVWAQRVTASVAGSATDETGAILGGVTITARNQATGLQRDAITGDDGRYVIGSLPVEGEYEIRAERAGFAAVIRDKVALLPDQTLSLDFALRVAAQELIVVGTSVEPRLDRDQSTVRQTVSEQMVHALPLFGRGFMPLISLASGFTGNADFPSAQGQPYWTNNVLVDGASHFSKWRSAPRSFYSGYGLESIKQIQVLTNLFSAEFGEAMASITSVTTKAGTNEHHGSALLFVRDDGLDAVPPFSTETPEAGAQQFGFSLGGPVVKDRTHYFASVEGRRSRDRNIVVSPAALNIQVPDRQDELLAFFRLDQQRGTRQLLSARYNGQRFRWHLEPGGLTLPGSGTSYSTDVHTFLATHALQLSSHALNEVRVQFARFVDVRQDLRPSVFVSRAGYSIEGGILGPEGFGADPEDTWEAADTVSIWRGRHTVRMGGGFKYVRAHNTTLTMGRGAYYFAGPPESVSEPFLFTQSLAPTPTGIVADPRSLTVGAFLQDDFRLGSGLTLNAGLRYDVERTFNLLGAEIPTDTNNVQPRFGAAWDVGGSGQTVIRGGVGLYTQQHLLYPINRAQLEGPDGAVSISLTPNSPLMPVFPGALTSLSPSAVAPPRDVYRVDPAFRNPYAIQSAIGVQRAMSGSVISVDFVHLIGRDLSSLIDVNAPASIQKPGQRTVEEADATRPLVPAPATYRKIITLGNVGRSWYRALQIKLDRPAGPLTLMSSYTFARAEDMAANYELPEDSRNIDAEKARADTDVTHNMVAGLSWTLPGTGPIAGGWSVSGIGIFRSNRPYTISWGDDRNGTTQSDARPDGRNTAKTGPYRTVDLALTRRFRRGPVVTEARLEVFNVFNATNYDQYVGELLSPLFAQPISAFPQRRLQCAVVLRF
jgi:hypothetical protein